MDYLLLKKVNQDKKAYAAIKDIDKTILLTQFFKEQQHKQFRN
jgi:hypothetical protein